MQRSAHCRVMAAAAWQQLSHLQSRQARLHDVLRDVLLHAVASQPVV